MRVVELQSRPNYKLMKQNDIVSFYHMQMPRWLFFDSKYKGLSLETKVAYTFLLNRFQLSKMNRWVNKEGEVFIIYTREKMAAEMGISYRKAISCFKELLSVGLIWEHRVGRGKANHIYMAAVTLSEEDADTHDSAPFEVRSADFAYLDDEYKEESRLKSTGSVPFPMSEVLEIQVKRCENSMSGSVESAYPEVPFSHSSKKDIIKKDDSYIEKVSQSCSADKTRLTDPESESKMLQDILDNSELDVLPRDEAGVFSNVIARLFYSNNFRVGNSILPQEIIRSHLKRLDGMIILDTREKLRTNRDKIVKNSTAYVMATLLNNIWEYKSDLMVDPFLNST